MNRYLAQMLHLLNNDQLITIKEITYGSETEKNILLIQETVFKKVYEITSNGELAGYVSDDFELFGKAVVIDCKDNWLSAVFEQYCLDIFPTGEIKMSDRSICEIMGQQN